MEFLPINNIESLIGRCTARSLFPGASHWKHKTWSSYTFCNISHKTVPRFHESQCSKIKSMKLILRYETYLTLLSPLNILFLLSTGCVRVPIIYLPVGLLWYIRIPWLGQRDWNTDRTGDPHSDASLFYTAALERTGKFVTIEVTTSLNFCEFPSLHWSQARWFIRPITVNCTPSKSQEFMTGMTGYKLNRDIEWYNGWQTGELLCKLLDVFMMRSQDRTDRS